MIQLGPIRTRTEIKRDRYTVAETQFELDPKRTSRRDVAPDTGTRGLRDRQGKSSWVILQVRINVRKGLETGRRCGLRAFYRVIFERGILLRGSNCRSCTFWPIVTVGVALQRQFVKIGLRLVSAIKWLIESGVISLLAMFIVVL